jgi:putative flippase GtrA
MERSGQAWREKLKHYGAYVFWGALTTLVNIAVFFLLRRTVALPLLGANLIAWVASVLFAFASNRRFVFGSRARGVIPVAAELARFFASRAFSGLLDMALMYLLVECLAFSELPVKIAVNVLVVVINYLTSLLFVFAKGAPDER